MLNMKIELEIEKELSDEQKNGLTWILNAANDSAITHQEALDFARLQSAGLGYWTYRGRNHVGLHLQNAKGFEQSRAAIFRTV